MGSMGSVVDAVNSPSWSIIKLFGAAFAMVPLVASVDLDWEA